MRVASCLCICLLLLQACKENKNTSSSSIFQSESKDSIIDKELVLLGPQTRGRLQEPPYKEWFEKRYDEYVLDEELVAPLADALNDKDIVIFMGTWCEDSQREVPALYKILDKIGYDQSKLSLITVSRDKTTPDGLEKGLKIEYVPTIIIKKHNVELNRFVESPRESLAKDLLAIANREEYTPTYSE